MMMSMMNCMQRIHHMMVVQAVNIVMIDGVIRVMPV